MNKQRKLMQQNIQKRITPMLTKAPWLLRVTEYHDKPVPVFVMKKRVSIEQRAQSGKQLTKTVLKDRGLLYGPSLRRCLPMIRHVIRNVCDPAGVPLELEQFLGNGRVTYRGNMPLDDEAGVKLALLFKLRERINDMNRVELIAWRIERFSYEEAAYWLSRATQYGNAANRWAQAGMRIMLGGQPGDKKIQQLLEQYRK